MEIVIDSTGPAATVTLTGRLDIAGAEVVALPLATLSRSKDTLLIDMRDVTFVASIGLRHLVSAARTVGRRGGRVILLNPNEMIVEVVRTSGLTDFLQIERTSKNDHWE